VVWGERIDPARFPILSVPLPQSKHRFRDIVLNDGAPSGERQWNGNKFPVFDELEIWQKSEYATFKAKITIPNESAEMQLVNLCRDASVGIEDWGTIRMLCAECSRGNPSQHSCASADQCKQKSFAFGVKSESELRSILYTWAAKVEDAGYEDIMMLA
jgi:hypothetical protein